MDNLTADQRRKNMQNIRSKGTKAEKAVMNELLKRGLFFTSHDKLIIGKPDVIFAQKKIAIFIDSDFWHGNPERFVRPKTNVEYWDKKIAGNKTRDAMVNKKLKKQGWLVIRLWEYDIKRNLDRCIDEILEQLTLM
jgi:DNA mismatch endonuclease, patch repair protein